MFKIKGKKTGYGAYPIGSLVAIDDKRGFKRYAIIVGKDKCIAPDKELAGTLCEVSFDSGASWSVTRHVDWNLIKATYIEQVESGKFLKREDESLKRFGSDSNWVYFAGWDTFGQFNLFGVTVGWSVDGGFIFVRVRCLQERGFCLRWSKYYGFTERYGFERYVFHIKYLRLRLFLLERLFR